MYKSCMYVVTIYAREMKSYFYGVGSCSIRDLYTNPPVKYSVEVSLMRIDPVKFYFYLYFFKPFHLFLCVCSLLFSLMILHVEAESQCLESFYYFLSHFSRKNLSLNTELIN